MKTREARRVNPWVGVEQGKAMISIVIVIVVMDFVGAWRACYHRGSCVCRIGEMRCDGAKRAPERNRQEQETEER